MKKKLLVFQPIIAPYRIDLFNSFSDIFDADVCLFWRNLMDQTFNYSWIQEQFHFKPKWIIRDEMGTFKWLIQIWKQLSSTKYDMVLLSEFGLATLLCIIHKIATRSKYKIVSIVDDSYNMVAENNQFSWKHKWATRILMPFMSNIINVEPRVAEYFQKRYNKGIYMPIIVDDDFSRKRLQRILPISQKYVEDYKLEGKKVLLFVGRLVGLKNLPFVIESFLKLNRDDSVFVIVGDGPEQEKLQELAGGSSKVIFIGRLESDALYAWYNIAQVFTLPSTQEAFGAVTNESLLGGCYALVSKCAGSNCLIREDDNGNVIDPYDSLSYSNFLEKAFEKSDAIKLPLKLRDSGMRETYADCFSRMVKSIL